jgi:histidine triad (HIT) family protein
MNDCIFCQIAAGTSPSHKIWEDAEHLAFLSIYPNTEGVALVIPKTHQASYLFEVTPDVRAKLIEAAATVAALLDKALPDVGRTGLVFEGFGVNHLHAKLYPMHGTATMSEWQPIESKKEAYFEEYPGYLSTLDGVRADDEQLASLAEKIRHAAV